MTRKYIITHLSVNGGEMNSYLEAVVDTKTEALSLMKDIYNDAARKFKSRHTGAVHSDPKWLDEEHEKLQIKVSMPAGYTTLSSTDTYFISWIWTEKTINPKWILE